MPVLNKQIKAFITYDPFIDNSSNTVATLFELSDISLTYAKNKQQYYSTSDSRYSLYVFKSIDVSILAQSDVDLIISVIKEFSNYLSSSVIEAKQQIITGFTSYYNTQLSLGVLGNLDYNNLITYNGITATDYLTFIINDITVSIWLNDDTFKNFYPDYEIDYILPFSNFEAIINVPGDFITALDTFNIVDFNTRIDQSKNNYPPTYSKTINIPYKVPNTNIYKDCFFAFNIYGAQGNYNYILKLGLYNYLTNVLNLNPVYLESIFPDMLKINEFFIIPRWEKIALPSFIGNNGINSQIALSFTEPFDIDKFITFYTDTTFMSQNTYNVPFDYNNILLQIVNGLHSEQTLQDFKTLYSDLITVTSTHPDFSRMSSKTQQFITILENMIYVADSDSSTEMFNKIISNTNFNFTTITRNNIEYVTIFFDKHQYYMIPKYKFLQLV